MVRVMQDDVVAQVFLELSVEAGGKAWALLEMGCMESPLMLEERLQVLGEGCGKPLLGVCVVSLPRCGGCGAALAMSCGQLREGGGWGEMEWNGKVLVLLCLVKSSCARKVR